MKAVINKMGTSHSFDCSRVVHKIWEWAIHRNNWITACYTPGIENREADAESRKHQFTTEWKFNPKVFEFIQDFLRTRSKIDLFVSCLNYQLKPFVSLWPDPEASFIHTRLGKYGSLRSSTFLYDT